MLPSRSSQRAILRSSPPKLWAVLSTGLLLTAISGCSRNAEPIAPQAIAEAETPSVEAPTRANGNGSAKGGSSTSSGSKKPSTAPSENSSKPTKKATEIVWEESFESALAKAKSSGKPVMIDFYAVWCGPCKMLDAETYTAPEVIAESANFINVKVDGEKRPDLMQRYKLDGFPTVLLADGNGQVIEMMPGFAPANQFLEFMRSGLSKHMVAIAA